MSDMETAYNVAALAVRQRFSEQHPDYLEILNRICADEVTVYSGSYDRVEEILQRLRIPFTMNPGEKASQSKIAFVNCSGGYDNNLIDRLKKQVENGLWIVSSDWALGHFLAKAFPNTVTWNHRATGDEVISVEASLNSLWSEVIVLGADPQWWLEASSHAIEVLNLEKVRIEAASHDLLVRHNAPVVAVSFDWGKGHVFHVISHFWCKHSRTPSARYLKPCTDFLKDGMKLSDEGIEKVLQQANIQPNSLNFAQIQTAATSTELIAQLCVRAINQSVVNTIPEVAFR